MSDQDHYSAFYLDSLAGTKPAIDHNEPQPGLYRDSNKYGTAPVRYWRENGELQCAVDGKIVGRDHAEQKWPYVAWRAVSYDAWTARMANGHWPDEDPAVRALPQPMRPRDGMHAIAEGRGIGDNAPDKAEEIRDQIESLKNSVDAYAKITSDEQCAQAQTLRARLLEVSTEADKIREKEKRPHFEAGKAVDAKWQPLVKDAKTAADRVRDAMTAYQNEKARREAEERAKAEAARRVAEEAARAAAEAGRPVEVPPPPPPAPALAPTRIKGAYGHGASIKAVRVAVIENIDLVFRAFQTRLEVTELLRKLAQQAVDAGQDVPGVRVDEQRKVV